MMTWDEQDGVFLTKEFPHLDKGERRGRGGLLLGERH